MQRIARIVVLSGAVALGFCLVRGAGSPEVSPAAVFWLIPKSSTFPSFKEVATGLELENSIHQGDAVRTVEFEVRDASRYVRIARLPYFYRMDGRLNDQHPTKGPEYGSSGHFESADLWQLAGTGPGDYQMALLINGVRASNVVPFRIDPGFDARKEPVLRLGRLEAPPGCPHGSLVAWIVSPTPADSMFTRVEVAMPEILADGIRSRIQFFPWTGEERLVPPGMSLSSPIRLERYTPVIDVTHPHDYQVVIGSHVSDKVRLDLTAHPLGDSWDAETPRMSEVQRPAPMLEGTVLDQDGKPYTGMVVDLLAAQTMTDAQGHYALTNLPAKNYDITCRSPWGYPIWAIGSDRDLSPDHTMVYNISFEGKYRVAGRVTRGGRGLAGIKVNISWRKGTPDYSSCVTQAPTDANGHYESRGPYDIIDNVGLSGDNRVRHPPPNREGVKPGMENVDFKLSRP